MYAQRSSAGRGRERAPYAALRQSQFAPDCECEQFVPVMNVTPQNPSDPACLDAYPLAMVYAPTQAFENLYDRELWLDKGTIFTALDFPFKGARKGR